jgi:hypothetical protein
MAEKIYMVVKLAPNVSSWCDKENNVYLSRPNKVSRRLKEGCDMTMINKGVKAGLIIVEVRCEEDKPNTPGIPVEPEHPLDPPEDDVVIPEVENAAPLYCLRSKKTEEAVEEVKTKKVRKKQVDEVKVEVNAVEENNDKEE